MFRADAFFRASHLQLLTYLLTFAGDFNQLDDNSVVERTSFAQLVQQPTRAQNILGEHCTGLCDWPGVVCRQRFRSEGCDPRKRAL